MNAPDLHPNERIVLIVSKHWIVYLADTLLLLFAFGLPRVAIAYLTAQIGALPSDAQFLVAFGYVLWALFLWCGIWVRLTDHALDRWVVTNERLIDIEHKGLFHRDAVTVPLEHIQDLKSEVSGILGTFLRFGTLEIQTAGEKREFELINARRPEQAKEIITEAIAERQKTS